MNTSIIKRSKIAFDILFYIGIVSIVGVLTLTILSPVVVDLIKDSGQSFNDADFMGVGVSVDLSDLNEATVTQMAYAAGAGIIASLVVGTYVAHQIRKALAAVLGGGAFREENYGRLRKVANAAFVLVPIGWVTESWLASVVGGSWELKINLPLMTIAGGLLALAVAEIYKAGISLQDESELTV